MLSVILFFYKEDFIRKSAKLHTQKKRYKHIHIYTEEKKQHTINQPPTVYHWQFT